MSAFSRCQLVFVSAAPLPNLQKIFDHPLCAIVYLALLWVSCSALQPVEPLLAIASPVLELADGTQPVTAVSWSSDEVHEWIAAGRVDGSVAFYSLTSKGQTSPNQTRLVVPEFVVTTNNVFFCTMAMYGCWPFPLRRRVRDLFGDEPQSLTLFTMICIAGLLHQNAFFQP